MRDADFERLYDAHAQGLFAFLVYRTRDRALAEDLVADTFERALRGRRGFDRRRGRERSWLYAIALNLLRDHVRRRRAETRAFERVGPDARPEGWTGDLERVEDQDLLLEALAKLSPEEREALALRFGGDLSLREIAAVTGESVTTAEGRVYRGLRRLRELIG